MVCIPCYVPVFAYTTPTFTHCRLGYSNSRNSWLPGTAFEDQELVDEFDVDHDAGIAQLEQHHEDLERKKARIEEATAKLQAAGMSYQAAYHKAFTAEIAREGGRGKRIRATSTR